MEHVMKLYASNFEDLKSGKKKGSIVLMMIKED